METLKKLKSFLEKSRDEKLSTTSVLKHLEKKEIEKEEDLKNQQTKVDVNFLITVLEDKSKNPNIIMLKHLKSLVTFMQVCGIFISLILAEPSFAASY